MTRLLIVTIFVAASAGTIAWAAPPVPASPGTIPIKCVDCDFRTCRTFTGPGSLTCVMTAEGCESWGECG